MMSYMFVIYNFFLFSLSCFSFGFVLLFFVLDPSSICSPPPFIVILLLFQLSCSQLDLRRYLSHQHLLLPFLDNEYRLLGVSSLFRPVFQHLMWLTLGKGSLKCECDCYIGLCIFFNMFLGETGEEGFRWLSK